MKETYPESFTTGSISYADCVQACGDMSEYCTREPARNFNHRRVSRTDFQWTLWGRQTIWCNLAQHYFLSPRMCSFGTSSALAEMSFLIKSLLPWTHGVSITKARWRHWEKSVFPCEICSLYFACTFSFSDSNKSWDLVAFVKHTGTAAVVKVNNTCLDMILSEGECLVLLANI